MPDWLRVIRTLGASLLLIGGCFVLGITLVKWIRAGDGGSIFQKVDEFSPDRVLLPEFGSYYPIQQVDRIGFWPSDDKQINLDIARYRDITGQVRSAIVFLTDEPAVGRSETAVPDLNQLRWQAWLDAAEFLQRSTSKNALFITWWDNAQRIDLLIGKKTWVDAPVSEAFDTHQRDFWKQVSGGFQNESGSSVELADWLLMDADKALKSIEQNPTTSREELYLLVTIDDLARLSEMQALTGKSVLFSTQTFKQSSNIHGLITKVKYWARANGEGRYLVQHLPLGGVRAWRIQSNQGAKTLLARLLPFTSSMAVPLPHLELVHRSEWSGYLSVYRWSSSLPTEIEN